MATQQIHLNQIVKKSPKVCVASTKISEVAAIMLKENCGCLPVVESVESMVPVGVITDRDIVCRSIGKGLNPLSLQVKDCMTKGCYTIDSAATLKDADRVMDSKKVRRVVLVDKKGKCCGVLSKADLAEIAPKAKETPKAKSAAKRAIASKVLSKPKSAAHARAH